MDFPKDVRQDHSCNLCIRNDRSFPAAPSSIPIHSHAERKHPATTISTPHFFVQGAEDFSYFLFTMLPTVQVCTETDYSVKTPCINKTSLKLIY